ncbi:MAG TPA: hypothetical protein VFS18_03740, partial [Actinomycetota bacterium]|nr:hypothetical protein [Actinomycetota bacterium]
AVLGGPLVVGLLVALAVVILAGAWWPEARDRGIVAATLCVTLALWAAGAWDDRRGEERPRGFKGHLGAVATGSLTGGLVKLVAGGIAGLVAGALTGGGAGSVVATGLMVALTANLVNLLDRAPGRALKFAGLLYVPALLLAPAQWATATAGLPAGILLLGPFDLKERAMLGDAGAHPLGGLIGLGLALGLSGAVEVVVLVVLVALNLASEKWSFSRLIDRSSLLHTLDMLGRRKEGRRARERPETRSK